MVWCETQKGAQSALIPGAPGRRSGLAAQPPAGRGAAKTLAAQAPGLPSPPPPLLCRMVYHLLMHLPVYIPPTKSSFVYGKELF